MNRLGITTLVLMVLCSVFLFSDDEENKVYLLKLGDEELKEKTIEVYPDQAYSARSGEMRTFEQMIDELKDSSMVYIGETHDSLPMHKVQLLVIQGLYEQNPELSIGIEMLDVTLQPVLDEWNRGYLSEGEFIRKARWYENWSFNWEFYADIFRFAREKEIPIYGLNVPRKVIQKIRMSGWDSLSKEEKKLAPQPDLSHEEHRLLIRTIFENTEVPHEIKGMGLDKMFEGLYRAQSAWDEGMAYHALRVRRESGKRMVVLAGSGHLLFNLGINRRAYEKEQAPFKTIVCVTVSSEEKSFSVAASLADYMYGLPHEERPAYPRVGLRLKKFEGMNNLVVERDPRDGPAKEAGFKKGDVIITVDGLRFDDANDLGIYIAQYEWEDIVYFRVLREGQIKRIRLKLVTTEELP